MSTKDTTSVTITFKAHSDLERRLKELAEHHGCSRSEVIRVALGLFNGRSTLIWLNSPDAEIALGDEVYEARAEAERTLRELERAAFGPRPPLSVEPMSL
jgi:predicted transcriptional regulator